jgi:hypothetical protein
MSGRIGNRPPAGAGLTAAEVAWVHDPDAYLRPFSRRLNDQLSFDPATMPPDLPVMLDTNFYILRGQQRLPPAILTFVDGRTVIHSGIALAELTVSAGILDPQHPDTPGHRNPLRQIAASISLSTCVSPSAAAWAEAGMLSGVLARTQLGLAKPRKDLSTAEKCCQEGQCRKILHDALIFLTAREQGAILVSANVRDMDLLMHFRPEVNVLLYRQGVAARARSG